MIVDKYLIRSRPYLGNFDHACTVLSPVGLTMLLLFLLWLDSGCPIKVAELTCSLFRSTHFSCCFKRKQYFSFVLIGKIIIPTIYLPYLPTTRLPTSQSIHLSESSSLYYLPTSKKRITLINTYLGIPTNV